MKTIIPITEMLNYYRSGDFSQTRLGKMYDVSKSAINQVVLKNLSKEEQEEIKNKIAYKRDLKKLNKKYEKKETINKPTALRKTKKEVCQTS
jgi:predicted DNA-binding protein YlxM (UPF0122 family)